MLLRLCIVIPVYNNQRTIAGVVRTSLEEAPHPVLVVDDGSEISVESVLSQAGILPSSRVHILRQENQGKGAAIQAAIRWAASNGFTHLVTLDGDGQHLPSQIPLMAAEALKHPWDLIIGSRNLDGENVPWISQFGRSFSNFWVRFHTGKKIQDSQSGMRLYPLLPLQLTRFWCRRYDFEIEVLIRFCWRGGKFQEVPIQVYYPPKQERVSHFHKFRDNARISAINTVFVFLGILRMPAKFIAHGISALSQFRKRQTLQRPWSGNSRGGRIGNGFIKWLIGTFGLRPAYALLYFIVPYFYLFAPRSSYSIHEYWRVASPQSNGLGRFLLTMRVYFQFGRVLMDRIYQFKFNEPIFVRNSTGLDNIKKAMNQPLGAILVGAHVGGWDISSRFLLGDPNVAEKFSPVQYLGDKSFEHLKQANESKRYQPFFFNSADTPILTLYQRLRDGHLIGLMGDRPVNQYLAIVKFLGKLAVVDTLPFRVAAIVHAPVIFSTGFKGPEKNYYFFALPATHHKFDRTRSKSEQLQEWAQNYADNLETFVRKYPDQWFNFFPFFSSIPNRKSGGTENQEKEDLRAEWHTPPSH